MFINLLLITKLQLSTLSLWYTDIAIAPGKELDETIQNQT